MATDNQPQPQGGARIPDRDDINDDDYDNDIPLQHRRPFGSGLHKRFISFVPAAEASSTTSEQHNQKAKTSSVPEIYLNLVLPVSSTTSPTTVKEEEQKQQGPRSAEQPQEIKTTTCQLCNRAIPTSELKAHEASIPHQSRLSHSYPPSAVDRTRMGLAILSNHGWDPDARKGLGASNQGIQYPLKTKPKDDKLGIGLKVPKNLSPTSKNIEKNGGKLLGAGQVRKLVKEEKRKAEKIRRQLWGDDKLERYLETGSVSATGVNKLDGYLARGSVG